MLDIDEKLKFFLGDCLYVDSFDIDSRLPLSIEDQGKIDKINQKLDSIKDVYTFYFSKKIVRFEVIFDDPFQTIFDLIYALECLDEENNSDAPTAQIFPAYLPLKNIADKFLSKIIGIEE